jgi:hypothetical protein
MQRERARCVQLYGSRDQEIHDAMIADDKEKTNEIAAKLRESRNREEYSDSLLQYLFHTQRNKTRTREKTSDAPSWLEDVWMNAMTFFSLIGLRIRIHIHIHILFPASVMEFGI